MSTAKKSAGSPRGGKRAGSGRPPLAEGHKTIPMVVRLTDYQREKLAELGGAQWIRDQIDLRIAEDSKK